MTLHVLYARCHGKYFPQSALTSGSWNKVLPMSHYRHNYFLSRDNIESTYSEEVAWLRNQYTEEDKDIIEKFLIARKSLKLETNVQELNDQMIQEEGIDQGSLSGKIILYI